MRRDTRSDAALVEACNGSGRTEAAQAFTVLYERHRDYVLRVALRFVRSNDLAADVLQETFTYLLKQFPPTGPGFVLTSKLTTFLYPVAKNLAISALRKDTRFAADATEPDALPSPAVASPAEDDLDRALATLSPERREVLVLRFVDDLSLEAIAAALRIPLGTVKSRLHLGIRALRSDPRIKDLFEP